MARTENSRLYHYDEQDMYFTVTFTRHAASVEKWIRRVKEMFLDNAPVKCVGLDCEYTTAPKKVNEKSLPPEEQ